MLNFLPSTNVGAILIILSKGSLPYGNVAPAGVIRTPADLHRSINFCCYWFIRFVCDEITTSWLREGAIV